MDIIKLRRSSLNAFLEYKPGEQPDGDDWIKLNTNENPFPPLKKVLKSIKDNVSDQIRLYPDPTARKLREKLLTNFLNNESGIDTIDWILIGNGSDEIIDLIFKLFINIGDVVIGFYPSYGMYETIASLYGSKYEKLNLSEDFSVPEDAFNVDGKLFFINSPNNPNGTSFLNDIISQICENFPGIVVVDEAYADFSSHTALPLLGNFENLVILRTFSKSFSLASLRLGYCIANPIIINELNKLKLPYNTSYISQQAGIACLEFINDVYKQNENIIKERDRMIASLSTFKNLKVFPSDANFVLVEFKSKNDAYNIYSKLRKNKILVRYYDNPDLNRFLRISIGKTNENNKLLDIIGKNA